MIQFKYHIKAIFLIVIKLLFFCHPTTLIIFYLISTVIFIINSPKPATSPRDSKTVWDAIPVISQSWNNRAAGVNYKFKSHLPSRLTELPCELIRSVFPTKIYSKATVIFVVKWDLWRSQIISLFEQGESYNFLKLSNKRLIYRVYYYM